VLIEIPIGNGTKIKDKKEALHLEKQFQKIGSELGMKIKGIVTDGTQPIGNGIGPALEARDVLWLLTGDARGPKDLRERSILLAIESLELAGVRNAKKIAVEILDSGKAYDKFVDMMKAQGGKIVGADEIKLGEFTHDIVSSTSGKVKRIDNFAVSKIARIAGSPIDKGAGIYLHKHVGESVKKGEKLFTIYAENKEKLGFALQIMKKNQAYFV
jgi:thymidine phosphorylase